MLRALGAGAAGVAGLGLVAGTVNPPLAEAANGASLILGSNTVNLATAPTALGVTQPQAEYGYGFGVVDGNVGHFAESATIAGYSTDRYDNAILGDASSAANAHAVRGIAYGGYGVYGSSATNSGVAAYSTSADMAALDAENLWAARPSPPTP